MEIVYESKEGKGERGRDVGHKSGRGALSADFGLLRINFGMLLCIAQVIGEHARTVEDFARVFG